MYSATLVERGTRRPKENRMFERSSCEPRVLWGGREHVLEQGDSSVRLLLTAEDTEGRFAIVETIERPGAEPPRHVHNREDEVVVVLEGRVRFYAGGKLLDCPAGTCLYLPRGCEHSFTVESQEARLLVMVSPPGLEGYYRELSRGVEAEDATRAGGMQDVERLVTIAARYGVAITGPAQVDADDLLEAR